MADGESIARHMQYAADWTRENLGSKARTLWEPDTFGHPGNMPQLARLAELDNYFHMRCNPGRENYWPFRTWRGIDGSDITTVCRVYGGELAPGSVVDSAVHARRHGFKDSLLVWGLGDHGGAVSRYMLDQLPLYRDRPLMPTIRFSTISQLVAALRKSKAKLPLNRGETYSLFEGCWTTHTALKKYNRRCENDILTAEALCALAGLKHNDPIRNAWIPSLFNHFHDLLDGSAVSESYEDTYTRAECSLKSAKALTDEALARLVPSAPDGRTVVVINQLGFERTEPVWASLPASATHLVDERGKVVPVQKMDDQFVFVCEKLPAFGRRMYAIRSTPVRAADFAPVQISESKDFGEQGEYFRIETSHAVARLAKASGAIGAYFDKDTGQELVSFGVPKFLEHVPVSRIDLGMNVFQVIDESPNGMSAWHIHDILREENLVRGADVKLLECGPVFARFRVVHKFRTSKIEEDVVFFNRFSRVDFRCLLEWREKGSPDKGIPQLKVAFGSSLPAGTARFEGPFTVVERAADGQEQPTQKWLDATASNAGFTLYNDSRYGCDAHGGRLRITLLRNPYGPDPEPDNGIHTLAFAFAPHGPAMHGADLVRNGMAFNRRPLVVLTKERPSREAGRLQVRGADGIVCTALRTAEHSDTLVLRFFEANGRKARAQIRLGKGIRHAQEVNFLENPTGGKSALRNGVLTASFRPYEVKTFLVDARGL